MKNKIIMIGLGLVGTTFAHGQATTPQQKFYQCQAECYLMSDNGVSLFYGGGNTTYGTNDTVKVMKKLRNWCDFPNLLVTRKLKSITTEEIPESESTVYYRYREGAGWTPSRKRVKTYTFTDIKTKAEFTTLEATPETACKEITEDEMPSIDELLGDFTFG